MERKPDWSRALPELVTLGRRTARTLGDVSAFLLSLPDERATKAGWQHRRACGDGGGERR